jgi:hypothetical protein
MEDLDDFSSDSGIGMCSDDELEGVVRVVDVDMVMDVDIDVDVKGGVNVESSSALELGASVSRASVRRDSRCSRRGSMLNMEPIPESGEGKAVEDTSCNGASLRSLPLVDSDFGSDDTGTDHDEA